LYKKWIKILDLNKIRKEKEMLRKQHLTAQSTRTAWAVFKYCGTKTAPLRR
jgi:hypothetical protein